MSQKDLTDPYRSIEGCPARCLLNPVDGVMNNKQSYQFRRPGPARVLPGLFSYTERTLADPRTIPEAMKLKIPSDRALWALFRTAESGLT